MLTTLRSLFMPFALVAALGLMLSSCGRKGDLDVPGTPATTKNDKTKPKVEDRPFILDPIL
ncbi:lipoprotein [Rhizobium sp. KVB221]|uniref:Lipoprotein n=1 Tax=Rhizobium setariae TaxID=2801340 RepID=A0A937CMU0_9HYPH|nr:lipoprotein [Rhizobium setariae]MBL0374720.1 lipoprotein [Rhizobium setariae]